MRYWPVITAAVWAMLIGSAAAQDIAVPLPRERPEPALPAVTPALPLPRPEQPETRSVSAFFQGWRANPQPAEPAEPAAPPRDYQVACPAVLNGDAVASALPPIVEGQCRLQSPLSLEAVTANGRTIPFNTPVTVDCGMASALPGWVADLDRFVAATDNTRIAQVNAGTGYLCRNVNNAREGNLSFHAFGDALDVTGFTLEDGRTIDVLTGWPGTPEQGSRIMRFARDAACTRFTTVLGPEANELHRDHLHLDLGCHGKSCTARLCE